MTGISGTTVEEGEACGSSAARACPKHRPCGSFPLALEGHGAQIAQSVAQQGKPGG